MIVKCKICGAFLCEDDLYYEDGYCDECFDECHCKNCFMKLNENEIKFCELCSEI